MARVQAFLLAVFLSAALGTIGGGIIAGPFFPFGMMVGCWCATPAGFVIGIVAAIRAWRLRSVWVASLAEFVGAVALGLAAWWIPNAEPADYALYGEIGGALLGIVLGRPITIGRSCRRHQCRKLRLRPARQRLGPVCCSECGQEIPPEQQQTLRFELGSALIERAIPLAGTRLGRRTLSVAVTPPASCPIMSPGTGWPKQRQHRRRTSLQRRAVDAAREPATPGTVSVYMPICAWFRGRPGRLSFSNV